MKKKKILLISYWINKQGNSPGIMADDKVFNLNKLGYKTIVLSSYDSKIIRDKNIIHYRIPSISFNDFIYEIKNKKFNDIYVLYLMLPIILTIGILLDLFEHFLLRGKGGGKWFWFLSAMMIGIFICLFHKVDYLFTTGGPASAHLTGILTNFFFKKKLFIELQDPLVGKDIGRSNLSSKYLLIFEKLILKSCYRLVFVTNTAAIECRKRNPKFKSKIKGIYSGAVKLLNCKKKKFSKNLRFIHSGTLYTSRNFKNLILAINFSVKKNKLNMSKISILNYGDVYGEEQIKMLNQPYIKWCKSKNRLSAIKVCCKSDILLLIQHTDQRSKLTFPFKLYEYLNLPKIIFALTNNNELKNMLLKRGHVCANINNINDISTKINFILKNKKKFLKNIIRKKHLFEINSTQQCHKIFKLDMNERIEKNFR